MNTFTEAKPQEFALGTDTPPCGGAVTPGPRTGGEGKPSFWDRIGHVPGPVHEAVEEGKDVASRSRKATEKLIRYYPIRAVAAGGFAGAVFGVVAGCVMGFFLGKRR